MDNIILLFLCLLLGIIFQYVKSFPKNAHVALNQFVLHVSIPAMALYYIPKIKIDDSLWYPVGIAWIGFLLSFVITCKFLSSISIIRFNRSIESPIPP